MSDTVRYKYPLQLPESLKETAVRLAKEDGVSLNQWIVAAVAQKIGAVETAAELLARRAKDADIDAAVALLDAAPDIEPDETDRP